MLIMHTVDRRSQTDPWCQTYFYLTTTNFPKNGSEEIFLKRIKNKLTKILYTLLISYNVSNINGKRKKTQEIGKQHAILKTLLKNSKSCNSQAINVQCKQLECKYLKMKRMLTTLVKKFKIMNKNINMNRIKSIEIEIDSLIQRGNGTERRIININKFRNNVKQIITKTPNAMNVQ